MSASSVTVRRLTAAAAVAAAVVGAVALPASAADHGPDRARSRVVISAVQADSPGRDDRSNRSLNGEWVEISNTGRRGVDLDGWTLSDADHHAYTFEHFRLGGRSTVRVHTGQGRDSRTDVYQERRAYVWNNDSDVATLRNDRGRFVDDASWGRDRRNGGEDRGSRHSDVRR